MSRSNLVPSPSASAFVTLTDVAARTPDGHALFTDLDLAFGRELTGLVGRNGAGKSTLARIVAGRQTPHAGAVATAGRIGWLDQDFAPSPPDETIGDALGVSEALATLRRILAGEGEADDLAAADWTLEARLEAALAQVGLSDMPLSRPTATLSGGQRTRLKLAALALDEPDLVVLDEPTNHLDATGRAMLADWLRTRRGGALVVSHDRALLRGMDRIVELSALGAAVHGGGYDFYRARRDAETAAAERTLETARRDVDRVAREAQAARERKARRDAAGRKFAARGGTPKILLGAMAERAENSGARNRSLTVRKAEEAEAVRAAADARVEKLRSLSIPMPPTGLAAGRVVLAMEAAAWVQPGGTTRLGPFDLRLVGPERVAVTGPNGSGKSTLLKLAGGVLTPTTGRIERPVVGAMLDQQVSILRPEETLVEAWTRLNPGGSSHDAHAALARFLFRNTAALKPVGALSGGEKLRAALACVMTGARPAQLLLLDEPTNHLDLESIAAVEDALAAYDGALLVVSHDEDFLTRIGVDRRLSPA